jgi:hypothetical protein
MQSCSQLISTSCRESGVHDADCNTLSHAHNNKITPTQQANAAWSNTTPFFIMIDSSLTVAWLPTP